MSSSLQQEYAESKRRVEVACGTYHSHGVLQNWRSSMMLPRVCFWSRRWHDASYSWVSQTVRVLARSSSEFCALPVLQDGIMLPCMRWPQPVLIQAQFDCS